jgi:hypothetical protein
MYSDLLQIQQRILGAGHAETLATMSGLAATYRHAGRLAEAETLCQQVLELQRKSTPANLAAVAAAAADLGALWLQGGQCDKAVSLFRDCLDQCIKQEPEQWLRYHAESLLGGALLRQNQYAEAGTLLRSGYEGLKARTSALPGKVRLHLRDAIERLAQFYEATGSVAQAAEWKQKLAEFDQPPVVSSPREVSMQMRQGG